jgi:outer membrane receptor protein involved in Fe transport
MRQLGPATDLQLSLSAFHDERDRGFAYTSNRTRGADSSLRLVGNGSLPWSVLGYAQWRELESSFASVDAKRAQAQRVSLQDAVPSTGLGGIVEVRPQVGTAELRVGADVRATVGESRELYSYVAGSPTRRRIAAGKALNAGAFAELSLSIDPLLLSAGLRLDHWRISDGKLSERQIASGALIRDERYHTRSGWLPTGRLGAVLPLTETISLRSAAYLGWRLPTLNELFRPFRAGPDATAANPLLKPERLAGMEAGVRFTRGPFEIEASGFANRLRDAIANVTLGQGPGNFPGVGFVGIGGEYRQRRNVDAIRVRGFEFSGQAYRGPWTARLGYAYADAVVAAAGPASGLDRLRPAQTPRHTATATFGWSDQRRAVSIQLRHSGAQFEDDLNKRRLPAGTTVDLFGTLPLHPSLSFVIRGENLLDAKVLAGLGADGTEERATPRTLSIGLRFRSANNTRD